MTVNTKQVNVYCDQYLLGSMFTVYWDQCLLFTGKNIGKTYIKLKTSQQKQHYTVNSKHQTYTVNSKHQTSNIYSKHNTEKSKYIHQAENIAKHIYTTVNSKHYTLHSKTTNIDSKHQTYNNKQ